MTVFPWNRLLQRKNLTEYESCTSVCRCLILALYVDVWEYTFNTEYLYQEMMICITQFLLILSQRVKDKMNSTPISYCTWWSILKRLISLVTRFLVHSMRIKNKTHFSLVTWHFSLNRRPQCCFWNYSSWVETRQKTRGNDIFESQNF